MVKSVINDALALLNQVAKENGIITKSSKKSTQNGEFQFYNPDLFKDCYDEKLKIFDKDLVKARRNKLRKYNVIPFLKAICRCETKEEFLKKKNGFIETFKLLYAKEYKPLDSDVFSRLQNENASLAEMAINTWNKFSK